MYRDAGRSLPPSISRVLLVIRIVLHLTMLVLPLVSLIQKWQIWVVICQIIWVIICFVMPSVVFFRGTLPLHRLLMHHLNAVEAATNRLTRLQIDTNTNTNTNPNQVTNHTSAPSPGPTFAGGNNVSSGPNSEGPPSPAHGGAPNTVTMGGIAVNNFMTAIAAAQDRATMAGVIGVASGPASGPPSPLGSPSHVNGGLTPLIISPIAGTAIVGGSPVGAGGAATSPTNGQTAFVAMPLSPLPVATSTPPITYATLRNSATGAPHLPSNAITRGHERAAVFKSALRRIWVISLVVTALLIGNSVSDITLLMSRLKHPTDHLQYGHPEKYKYTPVAVFYLVCWCLGAW
jgi:hypothetical protein